MARWIIIALLFFPNIALGGVYVSGGVDPVEIGRRIAVSQGAGETYGGVYASVSNGDIYKQAGGTGDFVALSQETRDWRGLAASPSTTGVTITSTPAGTTYNWASKEEGFNYNDANGYTYQLERERFLLVQEFIRGFISSWELSSDNNVRISVKNEAMLWAKKTLRIHSSSCPWVFKGTECGYSGTATWCDRNYARCGELLNTDNYGGFRFLPSIMEKEIWWGKSRK